MRRKTTNDIAIVGIGCRFPGGIVSPKTFWDLLCRAEDATSEVPPDRWDLGLYHDLDRERPDPLYTRRGGFVRDPDIHSFDPNFFAISPREAAAMDPQQRLLLETAWEAFEDAGLAPGDWAGKPVGVFVGLFTHDFEAIRMRRSEGSLISVHSATGMSTTIAANRVSHAFGFAGPSMVIDTACSSSLVAVHQACRSLRAGESKLALAGGVNLQLVPEMVMGLCKAQMMAPDGRCKSFDASGDGYARADGAGLVLLRPLADALAAGDPVYAVIHGTAVNQDGRTPGITVPSGSAQKAVIRDALAEAGIEAGAISYVEAHGTGTAVGDPIEARALGEVLRAASPEAPELVVGSVKSNFGHTEGAAGVAGLIKLALMVQNGQIPANLHFRNPNPNIPFDELRLRVPTAMEDWAPEGPRMAGVNSFGFGGTNAHAVIGTPPRRRGRKAARPDLPGRNELLCLSARSEAALKAAAGDLLAWLGDHSGVALRDVAAALATEREHHGHRMTLAARNLAGARAALKAYVEGRRHPGLVAGAAAGGGDGKTVFVFSGMGQQWWAMGRELLSSSKVFADTVKQIDALFATHTRDWSLMAELQAEKDVSRIDRTEIAQPAIFAVQAGLTALWRSLGVNPDLVVGHSVGEIAAAHASGALSLEQAVTVCFHRSRLQARLAGAGRMLALGLPEAEAAERLDAFSRNVCIAAVNSPDSVTLAGDAATLARLESLFQAEGVFARLLNVEVPYHSPAMDAIGAELTEALADVRGGATQVPLVSTVTGEEIAGTGIDADYWFRNVREPVAFAKAVNRLVELGCTSFVEIGAHPVLGTSIRECAAAAGAEVVIAGSLRRDADATASFLEALGTLHVRGGGFSAGSLYSRPGKRLDLPTYPWQRQRFWTESDISLQYRTGQTPDGGMIHPLLGFQMDEGVTGWHGLVGPGRPGYLQDHCIRGAVLFPAAGFLEVALAAAMAPELSAQIGAQVVALNDLRILRPLVLDKQLRTHLSTVSDGSGGLAILSSTGDSLTRPWVRHATCRVTAEPLAADTAPRDLAAIRDRLQPAGDIEALYSGLAARGLEYGPRFRNIAEAWQGQHEALGRLSLSPEDIEFADRYRLHPALLDSAFHLLALLPGEGTYLPVGCKRLDLLGDVGTAVWAHVRLTGADASRLSGDLDMLDDEGRLMARLEGLGFRRAEDLGAAIGGVQGRYYDRGWIEIPAAGETAAISAAAHLPDPATLAGEIDALKLVPDAQSDPRRTALPALDGLAMAILAETLGALGCPWNGEPRTERELATAMGIAPRHHRWFRLMLTHLARAGHASHKGRQWQLGAAPGLPAADALFRALLESHPDCHAELTALRRCADHLPALLRDGEDPRAGLFAAGFPFDHLASDSPFALAGNRALAALVERLVSALPATATLRIALIGGGTGAMLSWLVPHLPEGRCSVLFTDPDPEAVDRARDRFAAWPHLQYAEFDPERDPAEQGLDAGAFDLVIAADSLHQTTGLADALDRVRALLVPGGLLAVLETTDVPLWEDLVLGLHPGRWLFADTALRGERAALSAAEWQALLETRFEQVAGALDHGDDERPAARPLLLARAGMDLAEAAVEVFADADTDADVAAVETELAKPVLLIGPQSEALGALQATLDELGLDTAHLPVEAIGDGRLEAHLADGTARPVVVDLTLLGADDDGDDPVAAGDATCLRLRDLARVLGDENGALWVVTRDAQSVAGDGGTGLAGVPVWGFARSLANESRGLGIHLADLGAEAGADEIAQLAFLIAAPDAEDEIALRGARRFASRIVPLRPLRRADGSDGPFTSARQRRKPPADIGYHGRRAEPVQPGEVRVRLMAMGVNYKDFAIIAGLLDHAENVDTTRIGIEGAGIVEAVGPGVEGLVPGDRVFGGISRLEQPAAAPWWSLARMPDTLSFEEAAGITATFATGWHGLRHLARVQEGESVLIHSAASGLGLATIQIARHLGARVLVTAGSDDKRRFLSALGVEVIGSSRNAGFVEAALKATGGRGVDVIFSSLPVTLVPANLKALRPGTGRLIDVVNINHDTRLDFRDIAMGATVSGFDLNTLSLANPEHFNRLLCEVGELMEQGALRPTPYRAVPVSRASEIVNSLRRGSHIGKNVVRLDDGRVEMLPPPGRLPLDPAASYLVTGGLGGLGLSLARNLIASGARHLVLASRQGAETPGADAALADLRALGATVDAAACDMADAGQCQALVARFGTDWPKLDGIFHAAGLVRDGFARDMSDEDLKAVTGAKAAGAWHLHRATQALPLRFFVAVSSVTDLFGNPAQANYGAANGFVEALMRLRRAQGLPGLALAPGAIKGVGIAARDPALRAALARRGIGEIDPDEIWDDLCRALEEGRAYLANAPMNWEVFGPGLPAFRRAGRFALMAAGVPQDPDGGPGAGAPGPGASREERLAWLSLVVPKAVASVLGISDERLDRERALPELGFDSLMSAELVMELERKAGIRLRQGTMMRADLNTEALIVEAEKIMAQSGPGGEDVAPQAEAAANAALAEGASVDTLSDAEVESLLARLEAEDSGKGGGNG